MAKRAIVVFERIADASDPEDIFVAELRIIAEHKGLPVWGKGDIFASLDFRLVRQALPTGSCPVAIADRHGFCVSEGQHFASAQIARFAEEQSGYRADKEVTQ